MPTSHINKSIDQLVDGTPRTLQQFRESFAAVGKPFPFDIEGNPLKNDIQSDVDVDVNVRKDVCGNVLNPKTGLPEINWDRHKSFDPSL